MRDKFKSISVERDQPKARADQTSKIPQRSQPTADPWDSAANPAPDAILRLAIDEALKADEFPTVGDLPALREAFLARFRQAA